MTEKYITLRIKSLLLKTVKVKVIGKNRKKKIKRTSEFASECVIDWINSTYHGTYIRW